MWVQTANVLVVIEQPYMKENKPRVFYQVTRMVSVAMTRKNTQDIWKINKAQQLWPLSLFFLFICLQEYHFKLNA